MASNIKNMTSGHPGKLIFSFAVPLMAGNVFQQLYTVVDTMVVGKFLGVRALASLGASDWLIWMMIGTIQGFTQGFGIKMAQDFGASDHSRLRKTVGGSMVLALISSILLVLGCQLLAHPILSLLQTPEEILGNTLLYVRIMFMGIPIVMAYNLFASILRSLGDGKTPLNAMIIASLLNITLDVLFVFGFHWGIAGAAAATLVAQLFSSLFCFWHISRLELLHMSKSDFHLDKHLTLHLLNLGSPMAFQNTIIAVGGMIVQSVVNGFGVIFIAGFTASNKLYGLLEIAATSYGYAVVTYVGQNLGAGNIARIRRGTRVSVLLACVTSFVITGIMILFGKNILSCFISGTPEQVTEALKLAYLYLSIMSICLPVLYILHVVRSSIQGMGNTFLPMLSGVAEFFMRTGSALLLPVIIGETGVFYAEVLAWLGADIVLITSYFIVVRRLETNLK